MSSVFCSLTSGLKIQTTPVICRLILTKSVRILKTRQVLEIMRAQMARKRRGAVRAGNKWGGGGLINLCFHCLWTIRPRIDVISLSWFQNFFNRDGKGWFYIPTKKGARLGHWKEFWFCEIRLLSLG